MREEVRHLTRFPCAVWKWKPRKPISPLSRFCQCVPSYRGEEARSHPTRVSTLSAAFLWWALSRVVKTAELVQWVAAMGRGQSFLCPRSSPLTKLKALEATRLPHRIPGEGTTNRSKYGPRPIRASVSLTEERQQCSGAHHHGPRAQTFTLAPFFFPSLSCSWMKLKTAGLWASKGESRSVIPERWPFILCRSGQEKFSEDLTAIQDRAWPEAGGSFNHFTWVFHPSNLENIES